MDPVRRLAVLVLCCALGVGAGAAQGDFAPPTPEQLAAQERVRPQVTAIWNDLRSPAKPDLDRRKLFWDISDRLIAIGPDVVPFMVAEIDLTDMVTFNISAYVLGRLGGPDAEAALRKAIRDADARGGRFGLACKKWATFGLALIGKPDVFELAQTGSLPLHHAEMVPDFAFPAHLATMIGRDAVPFLVKQLDGLATDPVAADRLEDTIVAIGSAGDPSAAPKLVPLLHSESKAVRAAAADALSRIADPSSCESVIPLLSSADQHERVAVATALDRWKPQPCYKAMVGRLEVEPDLEVRYFLYSAIAAMGGESTLPLFRSIMSTANAFDLRLIVDVLGRIGSKQGLNMLRPLLPNPDPGTVLHVLQAIASVGGEGAIDTLLATTSDRRVLIASSAQQILTNLGEQRVAPRLAEDLVTLVREPIGDEGLRPRIVQLTEGLVSLRYTEALDDLKAAIPRQSDLEIVESLTSCVRRLELLSTHGDDTAAWAGELASTRKEVRQLAGQRLAQIGSPAAIKALATHLDRAELPPEERAGILLALADARVQGAADLVERHLADPLFDAWEQQSTRAAAAFAARRIGGDRMSKALRASALRREGRDWATLVYLAVLDKRAALKTLAPLRGRRLRYPEPRSGREDTLLDGILRDLAADRTLARLDVRPEALDEL